MASMNQTAENIRGHQWQPETISDNQPLSEKLESQKIPLAVNLFFLEKWS